MLRVVALLLVLCAPAKEFEPVAWEVRSRLVREEPDASAREAGYTLRLATDRFLLELGPVRVLGVRAPASLIAWHTHDPTTEFSVEGPTLDALMRRHLPPIWSSPLARWLSGDPNAYPLVGHSWPSEPVVEPDDPAGGMVRVAGPVRVQAPAHFAGPEASAAPEELITTEGRDGRAVLRQAYAPIPPGDPQAWGIEPGARAAVSSIRALRPKPAPIQPGDIIHGLRLFDRSGSVFDPRRAFEPERTPRSERRADALLLIFERVDRVQAHHEATAASLRRARAQLATEQAARGERRTLLVARPVAVFDVPEFSRSALESFDDRWRGLERDALLGTVEDGLPELLSAHPPRESIDLFTPGATASAILIDGSGRLIDSLRLDGKVDELAEWIVRTLSPASADSP